MHYIAYYSVCKLFYTKGIMMNFLKWVFIFCMMLKISLAISFLETLYELERNLSILKQALEYSALMKKVEEKIGFELFIAKKQQVVAALSDLTHNPSQNTYDSLKSAVDNFNAECWKLNRKYGWPKKSVQSYLNIDKETADNISAAVMNSIEEEKKQLDNQFTVLYGAKRRLWRSNEIHIVLETLQPYFSEGQLVTSPQTHFMPLDDAFLKMHDELKNCFANSSQI